MRTRIAHGAAAFAADIVISSLVPAAASAGTSGAAEGATRARAHGGRHHITLAATRHHLARSRGTSRADMTRVDTPSSVVAYRARADFLGREIAAWRAANPPPAPPAAPRALPAPAPVVEAAQVSPPTAVSDATSTTTPDWACIRLHESGDRFNTPAAPGGAYGFLEGTWLSLGYTGWAYQAPPSVQDEAVLFLYNELGWTPWSTRFVCGL